MKVQLNLSVFLLFIAIIASVLFQISCNCQVNNELNGARFTLFENTSMMNMAFAIRDEDTAKIRQLAEISSVDFIEPKSGYPLLVFAILNRRYESAKVLLSCGADPNKVSLKDRYTPLLYACQGNLFKTNQCDTSFISLLLNNGAYVNYVANDVVSDSLNGRNATFALDLAIQCHHTIDESGCLDMIKCLLDHGANINLKFEHCDRNYLSNAVILGKYTLVEFLMSQPNFELPNPFYHRLGANQEMIPVSFYELVVDSKSRLGIHDSQARKRILDQISHD